MQSNRSPAETPSSTSTEDAVERPGLLRRAFTSQLPLQNETTFFILVNVLDYFLTNMLIRTGAIEANPVAAYALSRWGFPGMVAFKMGIVAFVCIVAQFVAIKSLGRARFILIMGILITGAVVVYSAILFSNLTR